MFEEVLVDRVVRKGYDLVGPVDDFWEVRGETVGLLVEIVECELEIGVGVV